MLTAPVFEIKRFAIHDGDGIRTTVFFKGCPLRCVWCHNPEGLSAAPQLSYYAGKCLSCGECVAACPVGAHTLQDGTHRYDRASCTACGACAEVCLGDALQLWGRQMTVEDLLPLLLVDRDFYETSGGGVTLSGGECLTHPAFCAALLDRLKASGIRTAVDTCGDVPRAALDAVIPCTDTFLYDLKAISPEVHRRCTGRDNIRILDNLRYLNDRGCDIEIRIPLVPDYNDGELSAMAELLAPLSHVRAVRLLPYHNYAGSKYTSLDLPADLPPRLPTEQELASAHAIFERALIRTIS